MTPLQFEELHRADWTELERFVDVALRRRSIGGGASSIRGEQIAALYRRACEHLALARARSYPAYLLDRLDRLTVDAHQVIYQQRQLGLDGLRRLVAVDFPRVVRANAAYVAIAALLVALPMLVVGALVYFKPELILSLVDASTAADYERMYSPVAESVGRPRTADTDFAMFGYYIRHNIGIAFQCFAGGLFLGVGAIFFMLYNGAEIGAVAGYLTQRGLGATFYSFVVTHGAFELTAIVLAGAAGLRLGHSLLAPKRLTRARSLVLAGRECAVILYGVTALLIVAAAIEAFWSSARWLPYSVKYSVGALCWIGVLAYLALQGRRAG